MGQNTLNASDPDFLEQCFKKAAKMAGLELTISGLDAERVCEARLSHGIFQKKVFIPDDRILIIMKRGAMPYIERISNDVADVTPDSFLRTFQNLILEESQMTD